MGAVSGLTKTFVGRLVWGLMHVTFQTFPEPEADAEPEPESPAPAPEAEAEPEPETEPEPDPETLPIVFPVPETFPERSAEFSNCTELGLVRPPLLTAILTAFCALILTDFWFSPLLITSI